jgi:glycosyltransferase involved in cell wall biosynthesis
MNIIPDSTAAPHLIIMGIRGVPAAHGGFETFAERLAPYLVGQGWRVTVYCQGSPTGQRMVDEWQGVTRIHIPTRGDTSVSSVIFDIKSTFDVLNVPGVILTLGYNTGFLSGILAACRRKNVINMDGIEWKRAKYGRGARAYLWLNERLAAYFGKELIADHPAIADHLATRVKRDKITVIPYGSAEVNRADASLLAKYGIEAGRFLTVIARAEPENSILEIVRGFSAKPRGLKLVVLGKYSQDHAYQRSVLAEAGPEVLFPGPIYGADEVGALRFYSLAYVHGHQVGGTNPSLVESLGAGNAIIAHDNPFNRWVAGSAALYFANADDFGLQLEAMLDDASLRTRLAVAARERWNAEFTWPEILARYQACLEAV